MGVEKVTLSGFLTKLNNVNVRSVIKVKCDQDKRITFNVKDMSLSHVCECDEVLFTPLWLVIEKYGVPDVDDSNVYLIRSIVLHELIQTQDMEAYFHYQILHKWGDNKLSSIGDMVLKEI